MALKSFYFEIKDDLCGLAEYLLLRNVMLVATEETWLGSPGVF